MSLSECHICGGFLGDGDHQACQLGVDLGELHQRLDELEARLEKIVHPARRRWPSMGERGRQ